MNTHSGFRGRLLAFYEKHETKIDLLFFFGGFLFDVVMLPDLDETIGIVQQVVYLALIGAILLLELVLESRPDLVSARWNRVWQYRSIPTHFFLGTLFNIYSLFFLKSSSFFSSFLFVILLMGVIVANEMKSVRKSGVDVKMGLYIACLFCFFSVFFPLMLGQVGWLPFFLALVATILFLFFAKWLLKGKVPAQWIQRRVLFPGAIVVTAVFFLYQLGLIPPVPLSIKKIGVYHGIEKKEGDYRMLHEKPAWKFWQNGDQDFKAAPGDKIFLFASIYSPARFADTVVVHWWQKDSRGWQSTDKIPMNITGGRHGGFRGLATKQNYTPGRWCVTVESNDGREIGRVYFTVEAAEAPATPREWQIDVY